MRQANFAYLLILFLLYGTMMAQNSIPTRKDGKWGLLDLEQKELIPFEQDRIRYLAKGVYAYWQGEKVYLYNHRLENQAFLDAGLLKGTSQTLVLADEEGRYGMVTTEGKKVLPFLFSAPPKALEDRLLLPVEKGNQINFGLYSLEGKKIIPPRYYSIKKWGTEYYKCKTQTGGERLFDANGKVLFKTQRESIDWMVGGFIVLGKEEERKVILRKNKKSFLMKNLQYRGGMMTGYNSKDVFCILSSTGKLVKLKADQKLIRIEDGKILICQLGKDKQCKKESLLDAKLNSIIPPKFDRIVAWQENLVIVQPNRRSEKYNLYRIGKDLNLLLEDQDRIEFYDYDWLRVFENKLWKFYNKDLEPQSLFHQEAAKLPEKYAAIPLREARRLRGQHSDHFDLGKYKKINPELIFPIETNEVKNLRDKYNNQSLPNLIVIRTPWKNPGPRTLLMDLYGKVLSDLYYNTISHYEEGLIAVYGNDTIDGVSKSVMGLLDMNGKLQIPLEYDKIETVTANHIIVQKYGLYGIISRKNEPILPIKYGYVQYVSGYFLLTKFGKRGIANGDGKILTPPQYDEIKLLEGGIGFEAKRNKKDKEVIFLNLEGLEVGKK